MQVFMLVLLWTLATAQPFTLPYTTPPTEFPMTGTFGADPIDPTDCE